MKNFLIVISIFSGLVLGGSSSAKAKLHFVISPTPSFTLPKGIGGYNRSYSMGFSFPIPKVEKIRLGIDFMATSWTSDMFYKFEKNLIFNTQKVGVTDNLQHHYLLGFSSNIGWILENEKSLWHRTYFLTGIFFGHPNTPNKVWTKSMGKITDRIVFSPYIRFQRPLFKRLSFIVGMVQFVYVPEVGFVSSLLIGFNSKLKFWE